MIARCQRHRRYVPVRVSCRRAWLLRDSSTSGCRNSDHAEPVDVLGARGCLEDEPHRSADDRSRTVGEQRAIGTGKGHSDDAARTVTEEPREGDRSNHIAARRDVVSCVVRHGHACSRAPAIATGVTDYRRCRAGSHREQDRRSDGPARDSPYTHDPLLPAAEGRELTSYDQGGPSWSTSDASASRRAGTTQDSLNIGQNGAPVVRVDGVPD